MEAENRASAARGRDGEGGLREGDGSGQRRVESRAGFGVSPRTRAAVRNRRLSPTTPQGRHDACQAFRYRNSISAGLLRDDSSAEVARSDGRLLHRREEHRERGALAEKFLLESSCCTRHSLLPPRLRVHDDAVSHPRDRQRTTQTDREREKETENKEAARKAQRKKRGRVGFFLLGPLPFFLSFSSHEAFDFSICLVFGFPFVLRVQACLSLVVEELVG